MKFPKIKVSNNGLLMLIALSLPLAALGYSAVSPYGVFGGIATLAQLPGNFGPMSISGSVSGSSSATLTAPFLGSSGVYQLVCSDGTNRSSVSISSSSSTFSWTTSFSTNPTYCDLNGYQTPPTQQTWGYTSDFGPMVSNGTFWFKALNVDVDTTFTVTSGCATVSGIKGGATTGQFATTATTCTPVISLPEAANGWVCFAQDITHAVVFTQTASSINSCTVTGTTTSGDTVQFKAFGY